MVVSERMGKLVYHLGMAQVVARIAEIEMKWTGKGRRKLSAWCIIVLACVYLKVLYWK